MAPEIIRDKKYTYSVDYYSLGVVILEMLTGRNPFKHGQKSKMSYIDQMNFILDFEFKPSKLLSKPAADLITRLLEKQPAQRIGCHKEKGVAELKAHAFFAGIDWEQLYNKEVTPPYIPEIKGTRDTVNVDDEFLSEMPMETPMDNGNLQLLAAHKTD